MQASTPQAPALCGFPASPHRVSPNARIGLVAYAHGLVCMLAGAAIWSAFVCAEAPVYQLVAAVSLVAVALRLERAMKCRTTAVASCSYHVGSAIEKALRECAPKSKVMFDVGDTVVRAVCANHNPTSGEAIVVHLFVMATARGAEAVYDGDQASRIWPGLFVHLDVARSLDVLFSPDSVTENDGRVRVMVHRAIAPVDQHEPFMTDSGRMNAALDRIRLTHADPRSDQKNALPDIAPPAPRSM
ncbi:hypothetical protein pneo_cds_432 [Pandoravirus neocaledonia]|uniref:Uncharacterized protein n=1 Tax=Pandoravirus neocaledonia TaxID=2107708 RepID=A0A2U7UC49_9VIRU|nr:hypothetical protein pneo_cds_432 [Pandoravirus neocaledonia]AVK76039.1 hypothetical protein pneo_cds_432 [Pandoravirus neocaledonia]